MHLILENEDLTTNIFNADNCKIKELNNTSGLIECEDKFSSAIMILKALSSNAKAILYDTTHKSLSLKLKDEFKIPTLAAKSKENFFSKVDYDIMLFTSGTTGLPSGVFKTKSDIYSEITVLENIIKPYNIKKMVASVPFIHIYGVLMLNLAKKMNIDIYFRERFLPRDLALKIDEGTLVATTPLYINALLQTSENYDFSKSIFVSSTAPLSHEVAEEFCAKFNTNLIQLYGSTESGGIAYRVNGDILWQPMEGVKCHKNEQNCLSVSSPWVSQWIYEGDFKHLNKQLDTFDEVKFYDEKFEILGRQGFIVKIGGKRYSCIQIENIIQKHPLVKSALVNIVKNENEKSLKDESLIAYIEGEKPLLKELKTLIHSEIGIVNFSIKIVMIKQIPTSSVGKKLRDSKNFEIIS